MNQPSLAKAAYQSKAQMIKYSQYIALVNIKRVNEVSKQGFNWTYSKEAEATLEKSLKGDLPKEFKIYGGENFICAQVALGPGEYLVFLNHSVEHLIGSNWHLSVLQVKDGKIDWFESDNSNALKPTPEKTVIAEIENVLSDKRQFDTLPSDLKKLAKAEILEDDILGEAPGLSENQKIFKALRAKPPKLSELALATKYGSPAGQIYAAILTYCHDVEKGKTALANLSTSNATTSYKSGCRMINAGIWDVASHLYSDGKFHNLKLAK